VRLCAAGGFRPIYCNMCAGHGTAMPCLGTVSNMLYYLLQHARIQASALPVPHPHMRSWQRVAVCMHQLPFTCGSVYLPYSASNKLVMLYTTRVCHNKRSAVHVPALSKTWVLSWHLGSFENVQKVQGMDVSRLVICQYWPTRRHPGGEPGAAVVVDGGPAGLHHHQRGHPHRVCRHLLLHVARHGCQEAHLSGQQQQHAGRQQCSSTW